MKKIKLSKGSVMVSEDAPQGVVDLLNQMSDIPYKPEPKQCNIHCVSTSFLKILKTFASKRLVWICIIAIWCAFWVFMIFKYVC